jgi:LL-diaminopimelate aminotransferase
MNINKNYNNLKDDYLFATIAQKVEKFSNKNKDKKIISLGIGDVTIPLCKAVINALHSAVDDMSTKKGFHGYGPYQGYEFLRNAIKNYYTKYNVDLDLDEIFVSDGAKSDVANIIDITGNNIVLIPDPVYPVYVDTNIMKGNKIIYMDANSDNGFLPTPNSNMHADIIYICSPNNPTGAVYTKEQLKIIVDYAINNDAIILFDAAYEAFISDENLPHSIYEIEGAKSCSIEMCSLSKTAGFTGTRCSYTIIPKELNFDGISINKIWLRRQSTKYNGVSYIIQKGAEAVFSKEGQKQISEIISYYKENANIIANAMDQLNIHYTGGQNSPYIWLKCKDGMTSWDFFDMLLEKANVVGTPGSGFGKNGEGFFRLTAFGSRENTLEAVNRIKNLILWS